MKKTTYECKICGHPCNGGGLSLSIIDCNNGAVILIGKDLDEFRDHVCGEEHAVQTFSDTIRKIKGQPEKTEEAA